MQHLSVTEPSIWIFDNSMKWLFQRRPLLTTASPHSRPNEPINRCLDSYAVIYQRPQLFSLVLGTYLFAETIHKHHRSLLHGLESVVIAVFNGALFQID